MRRPPLRARSRPVSSPGPTPSLGLAYALLGERISAVAEGSTAVSSLSIQDDAYAGADHLRDLVLIYILIGATDLAVQELQDRPFDSVSPDPGGTDCWIPFSSLFGTTRVLQRSGGFGPTSGFLVIRSNKPTLSGI